VFLVGGLGKLRAPDAFEGVVYNYRLLPDAWVRPVARGLPMVELALAAALLPAALRPYAAGTAVALLAIVTLAVGVNLLRGRREIDCGCFSSELRQTLSGWLVLRNLALLGLAWWLAGGPAASVQPAGGAWTWLLGTAGAVMVVLLYQAGAHLSAAARQAANRSARGS
jgi:hypothetical protein